MYKQVNHMLLCLVACLLLVGARAGAQELSSDEYYALARKEGNQNRNFAKATEYCEKALKLAPLDMDIKEYLGKCYMETGRIEKARVTLLEVLQKSPRRVDARQYLLNIETQTKRYSSAICYANELLEITPYSKTLWMRKINLYNLMDNRMEANRETRRLYQIFPEDEEIKTMYNNVLKEDALKMNKGGDLVNSAKQYEEALKVTKYDPELYLNLINLQIKMGEYPSALSTADRGLYFLPDNSAIYNKKIGVLQEMGEYQKAIALVRDRLKRGQSQYYSDLLRYLTSEAARHYRNSDPYELYGQVYELDKSNTEAHDYLLNTAISRGYYADAQRMLTQGLKANPDSKELLSKQLFVYESQQNRQGARATIEKLYRLYPADTDIRDKYDLFSFEDAKLAFQEENYKAALPVFVRLASHPEYGRPANGYIFSIYLGRKDYDRALSQVEMLIRNYPGEQEYILKKIDVLAAMEDFENAYQMARDYRDRYPDNAEYQYMLNDLSVNYIKYLNERENYETIKIVSDEMLRTAPDNLLAYNYGIGARVSMGEYGDAMELIKQALVYYPDSKELRLKEAGVYSEAGQHDKAVAALRQLTADYPYNTAIQSSLIEEMMLDAKAKEENKEYLQAMDVYREVLTIKPRDTLAAIKLANLHIARQEYFEARKVVDDSLALNPDNNELLLLKGIIHEKLEDYELAKLYQSKYIPPVHKLEAHNDHLDYLDAKTLKNQVIISYLKATTDSIAFNTSVASIEYLRFGKRDTYVARVNYAARNDGVGVQGEIDWYHTFERKTNILANVGFANQFFPKIKAGISVFEPFKPTWQAEVGVRYAQLTDSINLITGIVGIEKTYSRVWLNARFMLISDSNELYSNILLQSRFYMRNERDYAIVMASVGNAPEDQRLDFQLSSFLSYTNTMVGGGYFHNTSHRTTIGIMGNWYNFRLSDDYYMNQYHLFLTLRTRF